MEVAAATAAASALSGFRLKSLLHCDFVGLLSERVNTQSLSQSLSSSLNIKTQQWRRSPSHGPTFVPRFKAVKIGCEFATSMSEH